MDSNNDLLSDISGDSRGYRETNNQLLKKISIDSDKIITNPAIPNLTEDSTNADVINTINEILNALRTNKLIET